MKTATGDELHFHLYELEGRIVMDAKQAHMLPLVADLSGATVRKRVDEFFRELVQQRLAETELEAILSRELSARVERAVRAVQGDLEHKARAAVLAVLTKHVERAVVDGYEIRVSVEVVKK